MASWCRDKFGFSDHSSSLLLTSFFFDLGYTSIFGSLLLGGTLHIAHESQRRDPDWVATYIKAQGISFLKLTPSYLHMLIEVLGEQLFAGCDLQQVLLGGEPLNYRDIRNIRQRHPDLCLFNHYGPSENTIGSCAHQITDRDIISQHQNIGRPAHNVEAFILDRHCAVCPPYVEGDLYLAGSQLMTSYLNPQNNENRLVQWTNPQWSNKNKLIYRSGDRAYRTIDGDIIFKGREQQTVKIDGYRVDLSAVQQVIHGYRGVKDCLVDSFKRRDETVIIVALLIRQPPIIST
ncbi:AMP-binding protein [Vibrio sp. PP-XX7]